MRMDSVIVGGGIAGLQAAIQLGRYEHRVLVVDKGFGRSTLCRGYHNLLGWPDGVTGSELREKGRLQAEALGVVFVQDEVVRAEKAHGGGFRLFGASAAEPFEADTVLLATGILDRYPELPGLVPCLGQSIYVCPDCDGYEIRNKRTVVLGAGDAGARMALLLRERTADLAYVNHERKPIDAELRDKLNAKGVRYVENEIAEVRADADGWVSGLRLADGDELEAERGFIAFGGNRVFSELAQLLGIERHENGHILTDPRTKMTNVPGVWAAGDVAVHSEQVSIAMGDGAQAAIWINKTIRAKKRELAHAVRKEG